MAKAFLTAQWRNLLMANYEIDPRILRKYVPCYTELDSFKGVYYVSLVGFLFKDTKVRGLSFPFHRTFEEVNLRFYVRYKKDGQWRRGVVFLKEIVPRRLITFVANRIYREKYATHAMNHVWQTTDKGLQVEYSWKVGREWNYLKALASREPRAIAQGSEEEFITEHYWGYTFVDEQCTGVYEVAHPQWKVHAVEQYHIKCHVAELYGNDFVQALSGTPKSVFLAEGSEIQVMSGSKTFR